MSELQHTKKEMIKNLKETIKGMKSLLSYHEHELAKSSDNTFFHQGRVKNTTEYIEELEETLNKLEMEEQK